MRTKRSRASRSAGTPKQMWQLERPLLRTNQERLFPRSPSSSGAFVQVAKVAAQAFQNFPLSSTGMAAGHAAITLGKTGKARQHKTIQSMRQ